MEGRHGRKLLCAVLLVAAAAGRGHAEKKKPGLFDFDTWKTPAARERDAAQNLVPTGLDTAPAVAAASRGRTMRLRIYADPEYRGLVLHWQAKARAQVERINAIVEPVFGARFEVESLRAWEQPHIGMPMERVLGELEKMDPATEVDWVVGLVTPLRGVAASLHHIGYGGLLARHFLLKGMDDEQESLALDREFALLSPEERRRIYTERKAHKEVVVFLHEWGHTMGLLHNEDRTVIMNPLYDPRQRGFSDFEKRVAALVVDRRLTRRSQPYPETADLVPLLAAAPPDEGSDQERADLLGFARQRARAGNAPPRESADGLPEADVVAFNRAVAAVNEHRPEEAWGLLAPVIPHAAARKTSPKTWARIAELAAATGALTAADEAATRAGSADTDAQKVTARVESERHRLALPLDGARFGVPPEKEASYVAGYLDAQEKVSSDDLAGASVRLRALAATFPGAPGIDVLTCDFELKKKRADAASKSCDAALEKFKGATRAHVLLAVIAARARKDGVAEQHLRRAMLLDPADPTAWRALGQLYRNTGAKQRLSELDREHRSLLSSPLPE